MRGILPERQKPPGRCYRKPVHVMDVYLVPLSAERYELYCEVPDEPNEPGADPPQGVLQRVRQRLRQILAEAERERREGRRDPPEGGWIARIEARAMCWIAESLAEQRLLWHLRGQTEARLFYPDDVDEASAVSLLRKRLQRDYDRHRFWLMVDALVFIASGVLVLLPGPNVLAYYFAFRLVGHYLSLRGARQGLNVITWRSEKSPPLAELRHAIALDPELRARRVSDVAGQLHLEHLVSFFERTAIPAR
jgi:hypothetical protein